MYITSTLFFAIHWADWAEQTANFETHFIVVLTE